MAMFGTFTVSVQAQSALQALAEHMPKCSVCQVSANRDLDLTANLFI
jgi:hypothetical protein